MEMTKDILELFEQMKYDEERGLLPKGYTENAKQVMGVK